MHVSLKEEDHTIMETEVTPSEPSTAVLSREERRRGELQQWRDKNQEFLREYKRKWRAEHPELVAFERKREYIRRRRRRHKLRLRRIAQRRRRAAQRLAKSGQPNRLTPSNPAPPCNMNEAVGIAVQKMVGRTLGCTEIHVFRCPVLARVRNHCSSHRQRPMKS